MELDITSTAEQDLDSLRDTEARRRIVKKIDNIGKKVVDQGVPPEKAVEKRLRKGWSPLLQQRVGDYRVWFVQGKDTETGSEGVLYVVRVLDKDTQKKLRGVDINPDTYL